MNTKIRKITAGTIFAVISVRQVLLFVQFMVIFIGHGNALINYPGVFYFIKGVPMGEVFTSFAYALFFDIIRMACPMALLYSVVKNKKLGILTIVALVFEGWAIIKSIQFNMPIMWPIAWSLINPILIIAAYYIYKKPAKATAKTVSATAGHQQNIYEQQMKDGIITQEEYDQLTGKTS